MLSQSINIWLNGRSPRTQYVYRTIIERADTTSRHLFNKGIEYVTTQELMEVLKAIQVNHGAQTRHVGTWIFKSFFKSLVPRIRRDNPAAELRPPKFEDKLADRILTHEQVQAILAKAERPKDIMLIKVLYGAALRISEAIMLKKKDILGGQTLRVWGKGQRTGYVKIQEDLEKELQNFAKHLNPEDFLFHRRGDTRRHTTRGVAWKAIKSIATAAGFPQVSPHFFRHTHASLALSAGASIVLVQKSLRHADIQTTMRYLHVNPGEGSSSYLPRLTSQ